MLNLFIQQPSCIPLLLNVFSETPAWLLSDRVTFLGHMYFHCQAWPVAEWTQDQCNRTSTCHDGVPLGSSRTYCWPTFHPHTSARRSFHSVHWIVSYSLCARRNSRASASSRLWSCCLCLGSEWSTLEDSLKPSEDLNAWPLHAACSAWSLSRKGLSLLPPLYQSCCLFNYSYVAKIITNNVQFN